MTIRDPAKLNPDASAPMEETINYNGESHQPVSMATAFPAATATATAVSDPNPPVAFAQALDTPAPAVASATPTVYTASGSISDTAKPATATTPVTAIVPASTTASTTVVQSSNATAPGTMNGMPPGGDWVKLKMAGPATWSICTAVSIVTCCCFLLPCGVWAFLCPCDEKRAYMVGDQLYSETGQLMGSAHRYRISH